MMRKDVSVGRKYFGIFILVLIASFFTPFNSRANEFTSSSFRVLDPVMAPAGFSTSTGFQLWGTVAEIALGTSTASSFQLGAGFCGTRLLQRLLFPPPRETGKRRFPGRHRKAF